MLEIYFPSCVSQYSPLFFTVLDYISNYVNENRIYQLMLVMKSSEQEVVIYNDFLFVNINCDVIFELREKYFEIIDMCFPNVHIFQISIK